MIKNIIPISLISIALILGGCTPKNEDSKPENQEIETPVNSISLEKWETMNATFTRENSSQYDNSTLMIKYLSNSCALFEFRLMQGSESEDLAVDTIVSGVMIIDDNGKGTYETIEDAENQYTLEFDLSQDGQTVDVKHDGALEISPDGKYLYVDDHVELSDVSVGEIIEFLPTVATSLNGNIGQYTINYPDSLISDWFYTVEAVLDDSKKVLAKFFIAKDLSAVFRADDDIEPVMIFGSAQPMMDYFITENPDNISEEELDSDIDGNAESSSQKLVNVMIADGSIMTPKTTSELIAIIPADLPYTLTAQSLDNEVALVDENNVVTAVAEGETEIQCEVRCEDGVSKINIPIYVTSELIIDTVINE